MRAAIGLVTLASVLLLAWGTSTFFFMLEAWGARGMPKSGLFEAWAALTWCVGPLVMVGVLVLAAVLALRERRARDRAT